MKIIIAMIIIMKIMIIMKMMKMIIIMMITLANIPSDPMKPLMMKKTIWKGRINTLKKTLNKKSEIKNLKS